jgi:hypothetical protein
MSAMQQPIPGASFIRDTYGFGIDSRRGPGMPAGGRTPCQTIALAPVIARPTISVFTSRVPS